MGGLAMNGHPEQNGYQLCRRGRHTWALFRTWQGQSGAWQALSAIRTVPFSRDFDGAEASPQPRQFMPRRGLLIMG
jgi:hypothetical protein